MSRQRSSSRVGPLAGKPHASPPLDVDALLDDPGTNIIVCCGSGGVGKTTTAAALGAAGRRARPQGRRAHHRPGAPAGAVHGHRGPRQHPAAGAGRGRAGQGRRRHPGRDDARHEADLRRGRRGARRAPRRRPRSWPTPSTSRSRARSRARRSTWPWRSSASSGRAEVGALGPDRGGHPALALGAGLPRRARAARPASSTAGSSGCCWRRRRAPARLMTAGLERGHERADEGARRAGAARRADLRRRVGHHVRRLPGARAEDVPAAPGRRHGVPRGRRARAGRAARGGVLRRAPGGGAHAAGRAGAEPGQPGPDRRALDATRRWPPRSGWTPSPTRTRRAR